MQIALIHAKMPPAAVAHLPPLPARPPTSGWMTELSLGGSAPSVTTAAASAALTPVPRKASLLASSPAVDCSACRPSSRSWPAAGSRGLGEVG